MIRLFAMAALTVGLVACGDDHDDGDGHDHGTSSGGSSSGGHGSEFPACDAISNACHSHDTGDPGPVNECHDLAHSATDNATCEAKKDECLATCAAASDHGH